MLKNDYIEGESKIEDDDKVSDSMDTCGYEPYDVEKIRIVTKSVLVFHLEYWFQQNQITLRPEYQRNLVWDRNRESALIESLMLRIPIPAFYLDEDSDGKKSVIDGLQRINTIHSFLNDGFELSNLQYLASCNGKKYSELDEKYKTRIMDTELTVNILDERCPEMVKFDVFRRVNTGGLPLNPQEIRNIKAKPEVRNLLGEMINCHEFSKAVNPKVNDKRMAAQEMCLRFLALKRSYNAETGLLDKYDGLISLMDREVLMLNEQSNKNYQIILAEYKELLTKAADILGKMSFKKMINAKKISPVLFSAWLVALAAENNLKKDYDRESIFEQYTIMLKEDGDFLEAASKSTGKKSNIEYVINTLRGLLKV